MMVMPPQRDRMKAMPPPAKIPQYKNHLTKAAGSSVGIQPRAVETPSPPPAAGQGGGAVLVPGVVPPPPGEGLEAERQPQSLGLVISPPINWQEKPEEQPPGQAPLGAGAVHHEHVSQRPMVQSPDIQVGEQAAKACLAKNNGTINTKLPKSRVSNFLITSSLA